MSWWTSKSCQKFWDKVEKCPHNNLTDHYEHYSCWTPLCPGASEVHCADCGVYITECPCHSEDGYSGWSHRKYRSWQRKK